MTLKEKMWEHINNIVKRLKGVLKVLKVLTEFPHILTMGFLSRKHFLVFVEVI